jgi:hypothetical protein
MRVSQLVRREATPHASLRSRAPQLLPDARRRQRPPAGSTIDDAEQRTDGHLDTVGKPRAKQLPSPLIHPDLTALIALAVPNEDRAAIGVKVALGQRESLADPQPRSPHHHDQAAQSQTMRAITGVPHDQHDLLDARRISGVAHPLVARRPAAAMTWHRRRRPTTTSSIQQHDRFHDPS